MESWASDVRHALRVFARRPGFVIVSVLTLGFGVGANAAIFSVVDGVLLKRLPFAHPDRVVRVWGENTSRGWQRSGMSWHDLIDLRASLHTLEAVAAFNVQSGNIAGGDQPERISYAMAESDLFAVLGISPTLGRPYGEGEDRPGNGDVVVLSHAFWRRAMNGRRDVVGQSLELDGRPHVILGVMPPGFDFPNPEIQLWKPFGMRPDDAGGRGSRWVQGVGLLGEGVPLEDAQAEIAGVTAGLAGAYAETNTDWTARLEPMLEAQVGDVRAMLHALWGAVGLVLLIACANIASLALARATTRHREIALRAALGAGRWRLTRQLMIEHGLVAVGGGVSGLVVAIYAVRWLPGLAGDQLPRISAVDVDLRVAGYAVAVALVAGMVSAIAPAWRVGSVGAMEALRGRGGSSEHRGVRRWHDSLIVTEIAMAIVVVIGAGLLTRSFAQLMRMDPGFEIDNRLAFRVAQSWNAVPERDRADGFYRDLERRLSELPGVEAVGAVNRLPLSGNWWVSTLAIGGRPRPSSGDEAVVNARVVTPGYFAAMGIPLIRGRALEENDGANGPYVGVLNQAAVREYFGEDIDPIGQRVTFEDAEHPQARWFTVIGVVGNVRHNALAIEPTPILYTSFPQSRFGHFGDWGMDVVVHAGVRLEDLSEIVRGVVRDLDPSLPVFQLQTLHGVIGRDVAERRFALVLLGAFAAVAVALAMIGVYGIMSYSVAQRRSELSVRAALGAGPGMLTGLVVRHGMRLMLIGAVVGVVLSLALNRWLAALLFNVPTGDPVTTAVVILFMGTSTLLACLIPARRAVRSDPLASLRNE